MLMVEIDFYIYYISLFSDHKTVQSGGGRSCNGALPFDSIYIIYHYLVYTLYAF